MRLNKKGFTLIELIITIVLMLSLTILVIVGFTNISDEKKLEADKLTENQIITAAEQYFSSNYYLVNSLKKDKNAKIFVNLAKLVEDDYLNVTTKTSTEEKYNNCDIVFATYSKSGLELNYIPFEEIFDSSNSKKLGYETGSDLTYTEYLKYIGLEKKDDNNHVCMAEVFTASDIAVDIKIDSSFTESPTNVNSKNWYKKDIPLIVTISNKDNKANYKNEITSVDIKINNNTVTKTELPESTKYFKKYRIVASNNDINQVYASATTSGGKTANSSSTYYIDKETPGIKMVAYKTNDKTITGTVPSLTSYPIADEIHDNTWVNASGKKNVYLLIQVNDGYSGVASDRFSCTRISEDGADANKDSLSSDGKTYNKLYFYKNDKISTYECEGFDNAGNSSGKKTFTIKRDVTLPTVPIIGYKGEEKVIEKIDSLNDLNKQKNNLTSYSSNTWTNKSIVLKPSPGDNLSLVNYVNCTDSRKSGNDYVDFDDFTRVKDDHEGTFTFNCSVSDNAGNTNTSSFTVKRDITLPSPEAISFKKCNYNSSNKKYSNCKKYEPGEWANKYVKIEMDAKDDLSGVEEVCYATSGETTNYKCADTKVKADHLTPGIHAQGTSYIRFAIKDKAGNWYKNDTGSPLYTVKLDRIAPVIDKFENTKNTNCKTTTGKTCYYSHNLYLSDNPPSGKSIDVSGLSGTFKYNHCYDNAESDGASGLICESGFTSTGKNKDEVLYTGGYASRSYSDSMAVQHYTYQYYTSGKYYNLFYKIYDNAGNYTCYRYKLHYNNNNKYSTALPTKVAEEVNCD